MKFFLQVDSSCQTIIPKIKLEPHEVDQFLNFSPKEGLSTLPAFLGVPGCRCSEKGNVGESAAINLYQRHRLLSEIALLFKTLSTNIES